MTVKRRRRGTGHSYAVDGEAVPGVTKILGMLPNANLIEWAAKATARHAVNNWAELERMPPVDRYTRLLRSRYTDSSGPGAKRGTEVHRLADALGSWSEGDPPIVVPEELRGYVEAYRDFLDTYDVQPLVGGTELVVASRTHRYCGTADTVADVGVPVADDGQVIPPCRWLLEIKTTASGIWPESALQACAYSHAEVFVDPEHPDDERLVEWLKIDRCGAVWLKTDDYEFRPLDTGPQVWAAFLRLRQAYDEQEEMKAWVGGAAQVADQAPAASP